MTLHLQFFAGALAFSQRQAPQFWSLPSAAVVRAANYHWRLAAPARYVLISWPRGKRQDLATAFAGISEFLRLLRTGGRKPRNVAELAPEVKNLFLELHNFAGSQIREP